MFRFSLIIAVTICLLLPSACTEKVHSDVSFYYWRTKWSLNETERNCIEHNQVKHIFVRYFDVALEQNKAIPVGRISFKDTIPVSSITPVIYIKNEVFLSKTINIEELSENILKLVNIISKNHGVHTDGLQIDCDWTLGSRGKFMEFINHIKPKVEGKLSATIRLHQVKYWKKTGIPNVDYGVLMYYNMGNVDADSSQNSIYQSSTAKRYVHTLSSYPMPLDIALPIFSWGIQCRNNNVVGVLGKLSKEDLDMCDNFSSQSNMYLAEKSFYWRGKYIERGDYIKFETVSKQDLETMTTELTKHLKYTPQNIIFYDLDSINITSYDKEIFKNISNSF